MTKPTNIRELLELLDPTPKRPSTQIRERAEEIDSARGFLESASMSSTTKIGELTAKVQALEEYLDSQAGFPLPNE